MNNSESARKLNQAVNKAVGGAILQAKGAFSTFWSTFTAPTVTANTVPIDNVEAAVPIMKFDDESVENMKDNSDIKENTIKQISNKFQGGEGLMGSNEGVIEIGREADQDNKNNIG